MSSNFQRFEYENKDNSRFWLFLLFIVLSIILDKLFLSKTLRITTNVFFKRCTSQLHPGKNCIERLLDVKMNIRIHMTLMNRVDFGIFL